MTNGKPVNLRLKKYVFYTILGMLFLILYIGFFRLQITQSSLYSERSLKNSVRVVTQIPVRGNIYDRNGNLIVDNRPGFSLYLVPDKTTDHTIETISRLSHISEKDIGDKLKKTGRFQPVKIVRQIDLKKLTWIQENVLDLPGVEWKIEPIRHYARRSGLAHLLGTLGEVDDRELESFTNLDEGDIVGKKAVERVYDKELRGRKGFDYVKVDALGRVVDELTNEDEALAYPGDELTLTIDMRLQAYADTLLEGQRGALVAIDTRTGGILTLISKPDYDLGDFTGIVDPLVWNKLINDPHHPLYDRAYQNAYPPGSVYKLVAAIAALNEKIITPNWTADCPGYFVLGRRTIHCWNSAGHGTLNLAGAIKNSCNVYFYKLGLLIGIDLWTKYSRLFHFGQKTGVELTNENSGLVPSREYYDRVYGKNRYTQGMLANLAIGQGELLVTPLQMAQFTTILANKGTLHHPHLGLSLFDPVKKQRHELDFGTERISGIDSSVYDFVLKGMREVVDGGTGWRAGLYGIQVAGKTGTAQNPHGKSHAWFIGFAPYQNPEIAVAVVIENGGSGGGVAAPIAGAFLKKYFFLEGKYDYSIERKLLAARDSSQVRGIEESADSTSDSTTVLSGQ